MRKQTCLWCAGLALVVGALVLTDLLLQKPPGLTEGNIRRIKLGMTVAEVEALLGRPADNVVDLGHVEHLGYRWLSQWRGVGAFADVQVREDGTVMAFGGCGPQRPGIVERVRSWAGR